MIPLPIFPESGLSNSVIPPIYIGLLVTMLMTEGLGWPFISLMAPGYLAPILIIKPLSGLVIVIEAFISYLLIRIISDGMEKVGLWTRFFGTDAFFALLLVSILVKAFIEGFLVPAIGPWLNTILPNPIDYRNDLHGIGLVVVPLLANLLWRHGLRRAVVPGVFITTVTYLITRFVLIPYTNYSVSSFELLYEKIAIDFLESPKFYIILLVGAGFTTLNRIRFGWTTHGILIPSLLGIAWFTPIRVFTTFLEAAVILALGRLILNSRWMGNLTIEGPRKVVLLFTLGFGLKMLIGFFVSGNYPGFKATDIYGFAYLLPTLIAIEMFPVGKFFRTIRLMLQTSLTAAVFGVAVGFLASITIPQSFSEFRTTKASTNPVQQKGDIVKRLLLENARILPESKAAHYDAIYSSELGIMQGVFNKIKEVQAHSTPRDEALQQIASTLATINYELVIFEDEQSRRKYLLIHDQGETPSALHGWGSYVFALNAGRNLIFESPRPLSEPESFSGALGLFFQMDGRALFIAGCQSSSGFDRYDVIRHRNNMFNAAHSAFSDSDIYLIRGGGKATSRLRIEKDPYGSMDPRIFSTHIQDLDVKWRTMEGESLLRQTARHGFATLRISEQAAAALLTKQADRTFPQVQSAEGALLDWLVEVAAKELVVGERTAGLKVPTMLELAYLDREVFSKLAKIPLQKKAGSELPPIKLSISLFALDLQLTIFKELFTGDDYLIIHSAEGGPHWGIYVFRLGGAESVMIEVPNPAVEIGTERFGHFLFQRLNAASLHLSGMSRRPDSDDFDVTDPANLQTVFQLAHQCLQRDNIEAKMTALQVRGFLEVPEESYPQAVLSSGYEIVREAPGVDLMDKLRTELTALNIEVRTFDGSKGMVRFGGHSNAQMAYTESYNMGSFVTVWLGSQIRNRFPTAESTEQLKAIANSLEIPYEIGALFPIIHKLSIEPHPLQVELILTYVRGFSTTGNAEFLARLRVLLDERHLRFSILRDLTTVEDFILIGDGEDAISMIVSLQASNERVVTAKCAEAGAAVAEFLAYRSNALVFVE